MHVIIGDNLNIYSQKIKKNHLMHARDGLIYCSIKYNPTFFQTKLVFFNYLVKIVGWLNYCRTVRVILPFRRRLEDKRRR